jgi:hypothetical protein
MLVAVRSQVKPVNSLIDPPPSSDRRSSSRSPGDTFLKRMTSDSAVPPLTPRPPIHPGSCGIITTGHRGHGAIVPNRRTCRHFLTNPSYFICRRAGVVGWHLERHRARPGPPTRCCRTRSGRESRLTGCRTQHHRNISHADARTASAVPIGRPGPPHRVPVEDVAPVTPPSRRGDPGFGGLPLLHRKTSSAGRTIHPNRTAAPHPAPPAAARRGGFFGPRALPLPGSGTSPAAAPRSVRATPPLKGTPT